MTKETLPASLHLNQNILQDYIDCPRRFQLKALEEKTWPAASSSDLDLLEKSVRLGNDFHLACQQYFQGVSPDRIVMSFTDPLLQEMWDSFLPFARSLEGEMVFSEQLLQTDLAGQRLSAKFDLIVKYPDRFHIYDWKTSSRKPPLDQLSARVQTFLYPFVLAEAGRDLIQGQPVDPESIVLSYWYPLSSEPEISFPYSRQQHENLGQRLSEIISEIHKLQSSQAPFPLTDDLELCKYCPFRSLCDRGISAGALSESFDLEQIEWDADDVDIENISELEF